MMHAPIRQLCIGRYGADHRPAHARIEAWLAARPDATAFHRPAWVLASARGTGQEALFLTVDDGRGAIRGYLPLTLVHSPLFGRALVSSGFAVGGGIVADDPTDAMQLARAAVALGEERGCTSIELRGGAAPGPGWAVRSDSHVGFVRPLAEDDATELSAIPKKHRAEVRKGLERGYKVEVGRGEQLRAAHYALFCRSVHNLGTPVFPRSLFEEVLEAFGEASDILVISDEAGPLSSVLTLYHAGVCMPYWQGADRRARAARSNEVLYFRLMGHARARGCTLFDFGRSKVGSGPALWKRTWGFTPEPLDYYTYTAPGHEPRDINPSAPQYRARIALWKRLPPAVADRLGPFIARGLG